jgi:hypothetical protein
MFHLGRAVSSFDIAQLVLPIWRDRAKKKRDKVDKGAIIGSLIDEALFEFSSLDATKGEKSTVGTVPVSLGSFEDVHNWGDEMSNDPPAVREAGPMSYELGNLAALEDDEPPARPSPPGGAGHFPTPVGARPSTPLPTTLASELEADSDAPPPKKRSGLIGIAVVVVAVAAAAGAWLSGVIR